MDYLLDTYLFPYLPFEVDEPTRKAIGQKGVDIVQWADWVCKYQSPLKLLENHASFLAGEIVFFILCALTFIHAWRHGGRHMYVWIGITIHALNVENLCYWIPDMDNFWQAQGILTFFGMRAPLYILLGIYHMFDYTAYVMVSRLRLPWWAEGPAVGLCAVMLDVPYDIMGIKLLWWQWHDTDPNIYDRMYWVPWNSYYFHASFACSFVWILNLSRKYLVEERYDWMKFGREFLCSFLAGTLAFWLGTVQFAVLYHPLHDMFKVHSEITTLLFLSLYAVIVWVADRHNTKRQPASREGNGFWFDELSLAIALEYMFFMVLVVVADPVNTVSEGLHQPIGDCNTMQKVQTPTGMVLHKKKYLCVKDYDEKYFDFHCVPNGPPKPQQPGMPLEWYAICGTPFDNRAEYITIIWGVCILFGTIFYQMAARSGPTPTYPYKVYRRIGSKPSVSSAVTAGSGGGERKKTETPKKSSIPSPRPQSAKKEESREGQGQKEKGLPTTPKKAPVKAVNPSPIVGEPSSEPAFTAPAFAKTPGRGRPRKNAAGGGGEEGWTKVTVKTTPKKAGSDPAGSMRVTRSTSRRLKVD